MANKNIASDYQGFLAGAGGYDPMDWAGGTIQLQKEGQAKYTDASGKVINIDANTNMFDLANQYKGIEQEYANTYGQDWREQTPDSLGWFSEDTSTPVVSGNLTTSTYQAPEPYDPTTIKQPAAVDYKAPDVPDMDLSPLEDVKYQAPDERVVNEENETVEGRLNGLLADDSEYIQAAEAAGLSTANSRGLLNSSMAAGSARKAAIEAGLPIAQQDAGYFQNLGQMQQQGALNAAASTQSYKQEGGLLGLQAEASSKLSSQEALQQGALNKQNALNEMALTSYQGAINAGLSAQDARQQAALAAYQGAINSGLSAQEARQAAQQAAKDAETSMNQATTVEQMQQDGANFRQERELLYNQVIAEMELSSQERREASGKIAAAGDSFLSNLSAIQRDSNMSETSKSTAIETLRSQYNSNIESILSFYDAEVIFTDNGNDDGADINTTTTTQSSNTDSSLPDGGGGQLMEASNSNLTSDMYIDKDGFYWVFDGGEWKKYLDDDGNHVSTSSNANATQQLGMDGAGASNGMGGAPGY